MTKSLLSVLDTALKPAGFSRKKSTWNRNAGGFTDVVELQRSRTGAEVTANLGVLEPWTYQICWREPVPEFVEEPRCTVRTRIAEDVTGNDRWWSADRPETATALVDAVTRKGLAFFDRMHDKTAMENHLEASIEVRQQYPPPIIYWAALIHQRGDRTRACAILEALARRFQADEPWGVRLVAVRDDLGCIVARR